MLVSIESRIAKDIAASERQVRAAVALLDEGATVPFISRYRKEVTGGLDDTQLRLLEERLRYLRELEDRRASIIASIVEQDKMTPALQAELETADSKSRLEDLYLPYKPKRRTKAAIAREAGLEPLALGLLADPNQVPDAFAVQFVDAEKGVADVKAALDGARAILLERFSEDAALVGELRSWLMAGGQLKSTVVPGKEKEGAKYSDYFDMREPIANIPSHRTLALFRARAENIIELDLHSGVDNDAANLIACGKIAHAAGISAQQRPADAWLLECCRQAWLSKLHVHLTLDLYGNIRERAENEAIRVFGENLKDLLLAAPAGRKVTMGLDPGMRTGVKLAVVDSTGKVLHTDVIYPHQPKNDWDGAMAKLASICQKFGVELVSIGNGTGSRETDQLVFDLIKRHADLPLKKLVVSEAGASVYSASELAAKEFPDMDVTLRGAVSIARRLQDPLAELVKIDPKSIGVGQYQHDVNQIKLGQRLDASVEDCVNSVGVDLNTASAPLLARVAGMSSSLAENVVKFRDSNGAFQNRAQLKAVPRLGPKAYEQCAGFLRIVGGDNPLDASAVHPESYAVVERILKFTGRDMRQLIGDTHALRALSPSKFSDDQFGEPTVRDILRELEKPGRDPRPEFKTASYAAGVTEVKHLSVGMILEGVISNVAAFGAFVDLGVHQDGLLHISQLSSGKFIKDPREVVKAGQIVRVKVLEVDLERKRISLTMRLEEQPELSRAPQPQRAAARPSQAVPQRPNQRPPQNPNHKPNQRPNQAPGQKPGQKPNQASPRPAPQVAQAKSTQPPAPKLGSAFADAFAQFKPKSK
jgi:protein Tex